MILKPKVLVEYRACLSSLPPAFQDGEGQSISKGAFTLLRNEAVSTAIQVSMEMPLRGMSWWGQLPLCWEKRLPASLKTHSSSL